MLLFGNKVSVAPDNNDAKVMSLDMQGAMLKALTNQEKLLLIELQKTRKQIVDELDKINVHTGSLEEDVLKETLRNYSKGDTSNFVGSVTQQIKPLSTGKKTTIRIGVDMIPSLASTGEAAFEVGMNFGRGPKLPVFKLPALPTNMFKDNVPTKDLSYSINISASNGPVFIRYRDKTEFLHQACNISQRMTSKQKYFAIQYLKIDDVVIHQVEREMMLRFPDMLQEAMSPEKKKKRPILFLTVFAIADMEMKSAMGQDTMSVSSGMTATIASIPPSKPGTGRHSPVLPSSSDGPLGGSGGSSGIAMTMSTANIMKNIREDLLNKSSEAFLNNNNTSMRNPNNLSNTSNRRQLLASAGQGLGRSHSLVKGSSPSKDLDKIYAGKSSGKTLKSGSKLQLNDSAAMLKVDLLRSLRNMDQHTALVSE